MSMHRIENKHLRYLALCKKAAMVSSTCLRASYAAMIIDPIRNVVLSTGWTGAPRGTIDCLERGFCFRQKSGVERGTNYEMCASIHAEENAIIHCGHKDTWGATMYVAGFDGTGNEVNCTPCFNCLGSIINSGISELILNNKDGNKLGEYLSWDIEQMIDIYNNAFNKPKFNYPYYKERFES